MFHSEEVEIKITWQNNSLSEIHVAWQPLEGIAGETSVDKGGVSSQFHVVLPESRIAFQIGNLDPLELEWVVVDGEGHFQIIDESSSWELIDGGASEDRFRLTTSRVTFGRLMADDGIVIVGILDIGGHGGLS